MKPLLVLLTFLLMLLLPNGVTAMQEDDYIYDCQVQYSVTLSASYPDPKLIGTCTDDEMGGILDLVHSIVEQDYIASLLGVSLPEFLLGWESFAAETMISPNADPPTAEEIALHMTPGGIQHDLELEGCGKDDPSCEGVDDEEDENMTYRRRLVEEVTVAGTQDVEPEEVTPPQDPALVVDDDRKWTPIQHSDPKRRLGAAFGGCPVSRSGCSGAMWCCTMCNICGRRRRQLRKLSSGDADADGCETVRTKGEKNISKKERRKIRKFERRVSSAITEALQGLARSGALHEPPIYMCLGNDWELTADFDRHFFETICEDEEPSTE